jgi:hypothetical protein
VLVLGDRVRIRQHHEARTAPEGLVLPARLHVEPVGLPLTSIATRDSAPRLEGIAALELEKESDLAESPGDREAVLVS